jgi:lipoprotein-anchoring transpeptidase ErfK/SrfK
MGSVACRSGRLPARAASASAALALLLVAVAPAEAHLRVVVDKTEQRMHVVVDGVRRHSWPISTGRPGQATPSGRFRPLKLVRKGYSRTYGYAPMPYAIYFTNDGHAIHGTRASLGAPASHGCVRLGLRNAAKLFALTKRHGRKKTFIRIVGRDAPPRWFEAGMR